MTKRSRRNFIQVSTSTAAAIALSPLVSRSRAEAESAPRGESRVRARPVHLSKVRLTGGPLKKAQDATIKYLLELDPDRMMAFYRTRAGLTPKAQPYAGWDG